jgi:hypothetical protein
MAESQKAWKEFSRHFSRSLTSIQKQ